MHGAGPTTPWFLLLSWVFLALVILLRYILEFRSQPPTPYVGRIRRNPAKFSHESSQGRFMPRTPYTA